LEKERNFEDLHFTDYLRNSKGGATDFKVGDRIFASEASKKYFSVDPPLLA